MTSETGHATGPALKPNDWASVMRHGSRAWARYGVIWAVLLVLLSAWLLYHGFFATINITNMLVVSAPDGFVAVGMTVLILSGAFDLSAGATLSLCAVIYAGLSNQMPLALAALITLGLGAGVGVVNGSIVTLLRVNPFVATLGTSSAIAGAAILYTGGEPIVANKPSFQTLGNGTWFGVPISAVVLLVVALGAGVILSYTRFGRAVYAVGGNSVASRLCGIRVGAMRVSCYVAVGLCAAAGGMVVGSTLGVVEADVGVNTSLNAIAIVVVGGTSLLGGEGAMWRTACGFVILATIENVLDARAVSAAWQGIVTGCIIVAAVAIDMAAGQLHLRRSRRLAGRAVVDPSSVGP
jgi:ribose transport system permease protein